MRLSRDGANQLRTQPAKTHLSLLAGAI
ncbi:hypothetical protein ACYZT9_14025 [Pseudomonas sp. ZT5P21]